MKMRHVDHPEYRYCTAGHSSPFVFVFDRPVFKKPSKKQLAEYRKNKKIVEAHGGIMCTQEVEIAGHNDPFDPDDVKAAIRAVQKSQKDLLVYTHWNGAGHYSLSVGARKRRGK